MVELVNVIVKELVDEPQSVEIETLQEDNATVIKLKVAKSDMGKVLGKQGRIAKSIRKILKAASAKEDKAYVLQIVE
ncbi:KH domain-containing protein [Criibacterium bergeronii]|uniref:RNA-binding protein KhpA n=1 Tax=Criibacterium bergeronii TaxID=1871336 RepID=A0A552V8P6_9FIRM|nr:KH domain-containing protein [Criibacterium bergeronii]MBS6062562.1 KH domain-containing protein [Peptostreptococcaceae bacterium]TRW26844.1 KH domain-containing protein [Criibacterium bergeronii]